MSYDPSAPVGEAIAARVAHARSYPFPIPGHSYLFVDGRIENTGAARPDLAGRIPVLAAGSNQSPQQLARKYAGHAGVVIPAERGRLADFDVVYAAHLAAYGSVPATFQASPGTEVTVFVLWLSAAQLARMHATEGNYSFDRLTGVRVALDCGATLDEAYAYSARVGCLNHQGGCVAVAEIAATGRRFTAATQTEIHGLLRDRWAPGVAIDDFIADALQDGATYAERSRRLAAESLPTAFPRQVIAEF